MNEVETLIAISMSRDVAYIIEQARRLARSNQSPAKRCVELVVVSSRLSYDVAEEVAYAVLGETSRLPDDALVPGIAAVAAILKITGVDDHPLKHEPGKFSDDPILDDSLGGLYENIPAWRESQIQYVSKIAPESCPWCARAVTCIVAWWCWWEGQLPIWLSDWLTRLKLWHPTEAKICVEHLRVKFDLTDLQDEF